jgi:hypothetical protein
VLFSSSSVVGTTYHLAESPVQIKADVGCPAFEYCSDAEPLSKGQTKLSGSVFVLFRGRRLVLDGSYRGMVHWDRLSRVSGLSQINHSDEPSFRLLRCLLAHLIQVVVSVILFDAPCPSSPSFTM